MMSGLGIIKREGILHDGGRIAAKNVLFQLREQEFPDIKVILVYPFNGFTSSWPQEQRTEYQRLLPKYDKVVCACDQPGREAYLKRNRCLVDSSAHCIAYCTRDYGGTAYTVRYAGRKDVKIWKIDLYNGQ